MHKTIADLAQALHFVDNADRETVVDAIGELLCEERQPETDAEHEEVLAHAEALADVVMAGVS